MTITVTGPTTVRIDDPTLAPEEAGPGISVGDDATPFGPFAPRLDDDMAGRIRDIVQRAMSGEFQLTDVSILAMMRRRLDDMDQQIGICMQAIEDATQTARELGQRASDLRAVQEHLEHYMDGNGVVQMPASQYSGIRSDLSDDERARLADHFGISVSELPDPVTMEAITGLAARLGPDAAGALATIPRELLAESPEWTAASRLPPPDGRSIGSILQEAGFEFDENGDLLHGLTREQLQSAIQGVQDELRQANSGNEMLMVELQSRMQQRTSIIQMGSNMLKSMDESMDSIVGNMR